MKAGKGRRPDTVVMAAGRQGVDGHPTPKPLKVWEWLIERVTIKAAQIIFDPFVGSGTTMVACQNLNRKCMGIEIVPGYCAVILQRMTDAFPGIEIKRIP
jgi:DNA modification methylase